MDYELDRGIVVEPTGPGEYAANLDAGWVVGGGVNGGYALAVIGNAIRAEPSQRCTAEACGGGTSHMRSFQAEAPQGTRWT